MASTDQTSDSMAALIDGESRVPLHIQVRDLIRKHAADRRLVDETGRLKTEAELTEIFGVSRVTVRNAIQPLVDEGMFSRTRGKGTFLRSSEAENWGGYLMGFVETMREAGVEPGARVLHKGMTNRHDAEIAAALGERAVFELRRVRFADDTAVAIEHAFYPPDIGLELDKRDLSKAAIYRVIEDELGLRIKEAQQTISSTLANDEVAAVLGIEPGHPLTYTERLTIASDERPLELLRSLYMPEYFRFSIKLTRRGAGAA